MECGERHRINWASVRSATSAQGAGALFLRLLLSLAIPILLGSLLQACGGGSSGPAPSNVQSVTIDPINPSIAHGTNIQLHATANLKNKTTKDVTESVTWVSADSTVANVSNVPGTKGLSTGAAVGTTSIAVKFQGKTGTTAFIVTQATLTSITVQPVNPMIANGTTIQLSASGNFSDGSVQDLTNQVTWSSANSGIATVSTAAGTLGLVTGVSVGNTPITATLSGIAGSTTVTVTAATVTSITITVPVDSIAKGTTAQLAATCTFSDGTTQDCTNEVSWTSGNSGIATVSDTSPTKGLVTGVSVGNTTISGSFGGMQGSATVTVTNATLVSITVLPEPSIAKGTTVQLTATGTFSDETTQDLTTQVSWTSGDNSIAQVSNVAPNQGLVTGLGVGSTPITATLNGVSGATTVTVTAATLSSITIDPPDPSLAKGTSTPLTATGNFSDGSTEDLTSEVSWGTANGAVAQVSNVPSNKGRVFAIGVGSTSIIATAPPTLGTVSGSTTVTVTAATLSSITIDPPDPSIAKGTFVRLTATGTFSDETTQDLTGQASWTSSSGKIAKVGNGKLLGGLVFGVGVGSAAITAKFNGVSGSTTVTVTDAILKAIVVTPPVSSIAAGTRVQLAATGVFSDLTTQDLTTTASWSSSDTGAATVANGGLGGLVYGVAVGSTTITATQGGVSGTAQVKVTPAILTSITITPPNPSLFISLKVLLTATGNFSDGTTEDLTTQVSWTTGDEKIAQVSNDPGTQGLVTGTGVGSTSITATLGATQGSTTVTVNAATLSFITIVPKNPSITKTLQVQLNATGSFTDGNTILITGQAHWSSSNDAIAHVSDVLGTKGLVTGTGLGTATITAELDGKQQTTTVTVNAATLSFITIVPKNPLIANGTTVQLNATGSLNDGNTVLITDQASWTSSDNTIAQVSNVLGTKGLVTGKSVGTATITAELDGKQQSTTVTVTPAVVTSLAITPSNPTLSKAAFPPGFFQQFTATATFSDSSTQDVTTTPPTSWKNDDFTVGLAGPNGKFYPSVPGTTTITAKFVDPVTSTTATATTLVTVVP
jgi:trimeric autotransporter adhesin